MDALKSAGRALIRSPSLAKQSWGGGGRHRKLPENWTDTRETLLEGMLFSLKYLGMTLVEQPKGEELSAAAVKRIVATAKASGKKLQKVTLKVSPRGIILTDNLTDQLIENVSIYRISYCTADKVHDKVFAYIVQSQHSENLECHAFLCTKRKMAQAVTLTVAQAFRVAFEFWQVSKEEKEKREKASQEGGDAVGTRRDSAPSLKNPAALCKQINMAAPSVPGGSAPGPPQTGGLEKAQALRSPPGTCWTWKRWPRPRCPRSAPTPLTWMRHRGPKPWAAAVLSGNWTMAWTKRSQGWPSRAPTLSCWTRA
uniref:Low density lipoprotein receptor adapter protein 1 n=1 Tax=Oryctolagus cuniculus TaxID=9986 RepID=A0A5F9CAL6_RABIT